MTNAAGDLAAAKALEMFYASEESQSPELDSKVQLAESPPKLGGVELGGNSNSHNGTDGVISQSSGARREPIPISFPTQPPTMRADIKRSASVSSQTTKGRKRVKASA